MSWADVDAWAAQNTANRPAALTGSGWRAFADLHVGGHHGTVRCYAHASDRRIVIKRPCYHVRGKWRAWRVAYRTSWPPEITPETWGRVLVALDQWLEAGGKVGRPVLLTASASSPRP